jgi:hypothetical protein
MEKAKNIDQVFGVLVIFYSWLKDKLNMREKRFRYGF